MTRLPLPGVLRIAAVALIALAGADLVRADCNKGECNPATSSGGAPGGQCGHFCSALSLTCPAGVTGEITWTTGGCDCASSQSCTEFSINVPHKAYMRCVCEPSEEICIEDGVVRDDYRAVRSCTQ